MHIRPFQPGDESALAHICLVTADAGEDATGQLPDDALWGDLFVLPYVARHPDCAWVVDAGDGEDGTPGTPIGYIVGAPDTAAFEAWFGEVWWPSRGWEKPGEAEPGAEQSTVDGLLRYGFSRNADAPGINDAEYPAHLHIDLLPHTQGQGFGRALIQTLLGRFRDLGLPGVHLEASPRNTGALAFYPRVGFTALPAAEDTRRFGQKL